MATNQSQRGGVCVIGAGVAGISAMKALKEYGVAFDCFDERAAVGGIWAYQEEPGRACAWSTLNMNSPRGTYSFSDIPMPDGFADFPRREECWRYLEDVVDRLGLRASIRLGERVERVEKVDGGWRVTRAGGGSGVYGSVIVANGHHNEPSYAEVEGEFAGRSIHSRDYRRRDPYQGKRVLVVGYGNSGSQIAVDVSFAAEQTFLAMRSGTWVIPHYVRGIRIDRIFDERTLGYVPQWVDSAIGSLLYRLLIGRPDRMGLPKPPRGLGYIFPTISESLCNRLGDGRIRVTREPVRYDGNVVTFADGTSEEVDEIIHATGYRLTFPFLDDSVLAPDGNRVRLYMRTFLPDDPTLSVIGAYQAQGQWGFLPLMETQARLSAAHIAGVYALPDRERMMEAITADERHTAANFVDTPRHHYQMLGPVFRRRCERELKAGRRRAARAPAPVAAPERAAPVRA